jgi:hypothetical protein
VSVASWTIQRDVANVMLSLEKLNRMYCKMGVHSPEPAGMIYRCLTCGAPLFLRASPASPR